MQNFSQIGEVPWPDLVRESEIITLNWFSEHRQTRLTFGWLSEHG